MNMDKARITETAEESDSNINSCMVCCEETESFAIGVCDHPICFKCCARMRVLSNQKYCPSCRTDLEQVKAHYTYYMQYSWLWCGVLYIFYFDLLITFLCTFSQGSIQKHVISPIKKKSHRCRLINLLVSQSSNIFLFNFLLAPQTFPFS